MKEICACGKRNFKNRREALKHLNKMISDPQYRSRITARKVYRCPTGDKKFHLTSRKSG